MPYDICYENHHFLSLNTSGARGQSPRTSSSPQAAVLKTVFPTTHPHAYKHPMFNCSLLRCFCPHSVHPHGCLYPNTRSDLTKETARGHGRSRRSSRMASRGERTIREDRLRRNSTRPFPDVANAANLHRVAVAKILAIRFTHETFSAPARAVIARRIYTPSIHAVHLRHAIHLWHRSRMTSLTRVDVSTTAHFRNPADCMGRFGHKLLKHEASALRCRDENMSTSTA